MKCISCNKKLKHLLRCKDMVDGGIVETVVAGYGSNYDGDKFKVVVCDECIKAKIIKSSK